MLIVIFHPLGRYNKCAPVQVMEGYRGSVWDEGGRLWCTQ